MKKRNLIWGICLLAAFGIWTCALSFVDVAAIGPEGSKVGMATLNSFFHDLTGVQLSFYILTDWLSLITPCFIGGFALLGLVQWIRRKHIAKVDRSILVLGGFYVAVLAAYLFFEVFEVNYRPILIDGVLEASYPSSTTMLMLCVMPTAAMELFPRIKNKALRTLMIIILSVYTFGMVALRLLSGVHWFSDIVGGVLLSAGLVMLYRFTSQPKSNSV